MGTCSLKKNKAFPKWGRAHSRKTRLSPSGDMLPQEKGGFPLNLKHKFTQIVTYSNSKSSEAHTPLLCLYMISVLLLAHRKQPTP